MVERRERRETQRVQVRDGNGNLHTAIEMTMMIGSAEGGRMVWMKGTRGWSLANGRGLNTDDDREFADTDGRTYTLVE